MINSNPQFCTLINRVAFLFSHCVVVAMFVAVGTLQGFSLHMHTGLHVTSKMYNRNSDIHFCLGVTADFASPYITMVYYYNGETPGKTLSIPSLGHCTHSNCL